MWNFEDGDIMEMVILEMVFYDLYERKSGYQFIVLVIHLPHTLVKFLENNSWCSKLEKINLR